MIPEDSTPFDSGPFGPATRAEVARLFGQETAVAGFLHVCREFCKAFERGRGRGNGDGLN